jgi:hypothetical protein
VLNDSAVDDNGPPVVDTTAAEGEQQSGQGELTGRTDLAETPVNSYSQRADREGRKTSIDNGGVAPTSLSLQLVHLRWLQTSLAETVDRDSVREFVRVELAPVSAGRFRDAAQDTSSSVATAGNEAVNPDDSAAASADAPAPLPPSSSRQLDHAMTGTGPESRAALLGAHRGVGVPPKGFTASWHIDVSWGATTAGYLFEKSHGVARWLSDEFRTATAGHSTGIVTTFGQLFSFTITPSPAWATEPGSTSPDEVLADEDLLLTDSELDPASFLPQCSDLVTNLRCGVLPALDIGFSFNDGIAELAQALTRPGTSIIFVSCLAALTAAGIASEIVRRQVRLEAARLGLPNGGATSNPWFGR